MGTGRLNAQVQTCPDPFGSDKAEACSLRSITSAEQRCVGGNHLFPDSPFDA